MNYIFFYNDTNICFFNNTKNNIFKYYAIHNIVMNVILRCYFFEDKKNKYRYKDKLQELFFFKWNLMKKMKSLMIIGINHYKNNFFKLLNFILMFFHKIIYNILL